MGGDGEVCILAGGLSARMGRDKARVRLRGRSLLARVKESAATTGWPMRVIRRDIVPRCGPLGGVYTALKTSEAEIILFLACDMPFVPGGFLKKLIKAIELDESVQGIFAKDLGRAGFPFLLRRATLSQVEEELAGRRFALGNLAQVLKARWVAPSAREAGRLLNVNEINDLQAARQIVAETSRK